MRRRLLRARRRGGRRNPRRKAALPPAKLVERRLFERPQLGPQGSLSLLWRAFRGQGPLQKGVRVGEG
eukprot:8225115-Pyramimonas_sp.AAC.1